MNLIQSLCRAVLRQSFRQHDETLVRALAPVIHVGHFYSLRRLQRSNFPLEIPTKLTKLTQLTKPWLSWHVFCSFPRALSCVHPHFYEKTLHQHHHTIHHGCSKFSASPFLCFLFRWLSWICMDLQGARNRTAEAARRWHAWSMRCEVPRTWRN